MNINLQVRFYTEDYSWLCFRHAVQEASKGKDVKTEIDEYDVEYYGGPTFCLLCSQEIKLVVAQGGV